MREYLKKTNIVGTIGPASESEEMFTKLVEMGLNVARVNFSHGGMDENEEKVAMIKKVREKLGKPVALLLDNKGPEIRSGVLESGNEKVTIHEGDTFTFVMEDIVGNETKTCVSYKDLYKDVVPGAKILVDDGALEFEVTEIKGTDVVTKALNTAKLGSRKTMNVPSLSLNLPALAEKDIKDIKDGIVKGFDYVAASFVRRADDVRQVRELLDNNGGSHVKIISKIESQEGVDNFEEILAACDGIMVARGDMGVEIPAEQVPVVQKRFIKRCNEVGKPVITATQMLESMTSQPRPTRAEVSDVANAVYDRTSAIMLSGECAIGKYPLNCVETMSKISENVEKDIHYWKRLSTQEPEIRLKDIDTNVGYVTSICAKDLQATAIVAYTNTGRTARNLAGMGVGCPVFALTDNEQTYHQLSLVWNTTPILIKGQADIDSLIKKGIADLEESGVFEKGDRVMIVGGNKMFSGDKNSKIIGGVMEI